MDSISETDPVARFYYVRYGDFHHIGLFPSMQSYVPGQQVVIRSGRGVELGSVVGTGEASTSVAQEGPRILRQATQQDILEQTLAERQRTLRYSTCRTLFEESVWPLQLIDVEPLLQQGRVVLYYLGPHHLDFEGMKQAILDQFHLDVSFEPVGRDADPETATVAEHGCSSCGSETGGCGSSGGSGSCGTEKGGCCSR